MLNKRMRPAFDKRPAGCLRFSILEVISFDKFVRAYAELMLDGFSTLRGRLRKEQASF
jgi:hypothetical protein